GIICYPLGPTGQGTDAADGLAHVSGYTHQREFARRHIAAVLRRPKQGHQKLPLVLLQHGFSGLALLENGWTQGIVEPQRSRWKVNTLVRLPQASVRNMLI